MALTNVPGIQEKPAALVEGQVSWWETAARKSVPGTSEGLGGLKLQWEYRMCLPLQSTVEQGFACLFPSCTRILQLQHHLQGRNIKEIVWIGDIHIKFTAGYS